jgi:hypothetical protein
MRGRREAAFYGDGMATMATLSVRSGARRPFDARRIPRNRAVRANLSEQARTAAPDRQAGGHWFEPSTAHLVEEPKVLLIESFRLFLVGAAFPL